MTGDAPAGVTTTLAGRVTAPERPVLLPGWIEDLMPYGPDPVVFGAPRPWLSQDEAAALHHAAGMTVYYACCGTRGTGLRCWHCGQWGQITPEPERIDPASTPAISAI